MTERDGDRFTNVLLALAELYKNPVSDRLANLYFDVLRDLTIEQIEQAAHLWMRDGKWFPKPVELRGLIEGSVEEGAEEAWMQFCSAVSRFGYTRQPQLPEAVMETVRVVFGNWRAACAALPSATSDRGPELMGWRKQFISAYANTKRREAIGELQAGPTLSGLLAGVRDWEVKQKQLS